MRGHDQTADHVLHRDRGLPSIRQAQWLTATMFAIGLCLIGGFFTPAVAFTAMIPDGTLLPRPPAVRLDGADRSTVAVSISGEISRSRSIHAVYLVSAAAYADAVAAGPAAARDNGVILYSDRDSLPAGVADELVRLDPARVEVVGGSEVIGDAVLGRVTELLGADSLIERVDGRTAWDLAAALSARDFQTGADSVVVASAASFFDGLIAGPVAARLDAPLLLVTAGSLPRATEAELRRLSPRRVLVVGDSVAVPDDVLARIRAVGPEVERVSGGDRYATAAAVATRFLSSATGVVAASGVVEVGGLAAVPLAALYQAPILLTESGDQLPTATRDSLIAHQPRRVFLVGSLTDVIGGEIVGFADGRIGVPTETATYPAWDSGYHDPGELLTILRATEIAYPSLVSIFSVGQSSEGRDIWAAKVSDNVALDEDEPEVLVDALVHASEHLGVEQALYLLRTLTSDYATDPYVRRLVDERVIWIVFAVNPDGWVYDLSGDPYNLWRKNRQPNPRNSNLGTDLNRNYGYKWAFGEGGSNLVWSNLYWGPHAFSAPESRAMANFVASRVKNGTQQIRTHVTIHTHGELILYPFAYTYDHLPDDMRPDDYSVFLNMAARMSSMNGYGYEQSSLLFPSDGDEIDWMYGTYRIFSFTFELYPTSAQGGRGIVYPPDEIIAAQTARNRGALLYLIDAAACPYAAIGKASQYCGSSLSEAPRPAR
jgi:putative cell wall-binding protein